MSHNKTIIFNPKSAKSNHGIPNFILQVGVSFNGKYEYVFVFRKKSLKKEGCIILTSIAVYTFKEKIITASKIAKRFFKII